MSTAPPAALARQATAPRPRREAVLVAALAAFAVLRVALFAAAFPFFANVDEQKHVDMVFKYARGYLPEPGRAGYEPQLGELLGLIASPEYLAQPGEAVPPPPWLRTPAERGAVIAASRRFLATRENKEAEQPPAYYALAGAWLRLGRALGLEGARLLYGVRALGALAAGGFVWLAWRLVRERYRDDALVRLGVPLLAAVFPQDTYFYVTPDALSPLLGGAAFVLSLRLAERPQTRSALYAAAGVALAAALLTKWTNAALLAAAAVASLYAVAHAPSALRTRGLAAKLALQWGLALAPVALWCARSQALYGDPTGSALKVARLGWLPKPLSDWLAHPLFTPSGAFEFVTGLVPMFWRGELAWHRTDLALPGFDGFYTASTLLLLGFAFAGLRGREPTRRLAEALAALALAVAVATLAVLSLAFVFDATTNPTAAHPFFVQGRLIAGVLLPFALLYVRGLERCCALLPLRLRQRAGWLGIGGLALAIAVSELSLAWPVFASRYNFFHLP
jgi:hypothetical protein